MKKLYNLLLTCFVSYTLQAQTIALETFVSGFASPTSITHAGDDRLFVTQRGGLIRIVESNGSVQPTPFLTVTNLSSGGERGLLGLAFHPNYQENGYFYVNYTNTGDGNTIIARYQVSSDNPNIANPNSRTILLTINQPYSNHNGGSLAFGPDGYLYIGMGDGGSGGDPQNLSQNMGSLLGKMLRIDVDGTSETHYGIPTTNPFENEIWALGLRNPWKFSFDRETGDLWIADVGQNAVEEINKVDSNQNDGYNFGWRCYEGNSPYNTSGCQSQSSYTAPIATYSRNNGACSITGGYVYRGTQYPNMIGKYFFADYCNNRIGYISTSGGSITWTSPFTGSFATFGEDVNGNIYIAGLSNGTISKVTDPSLSLDAIAENQFKIYPNPANDMVLLESESAIQQVIIYKLNGQKVFESSTQAVNTLQINTSQFSSGIYLLHVIDQHQQNHIQKLTIL